jgi:hypothetical protein
MNRPTTFLAALLVLTLAGCRGALPCPDCDPDDDPMAEDAVPDLPCGGVDLQTDPLNCGSCGLECPVLYADTEYAVGQCNDGVCGGPYWYEEAYYEFPFVYPAISCAEICANDSRTCVERGCSGKTGYMCGYLWQEGCLNAEFPLMIGWTGGCTENVSWPEFDLSLQPALGCCCD